MHMLAVLGRATSNTNVVIDEKETLGERIADIVAAFRGSWIFIIAFVLALAAYNTARAVLGHARGDP